MKKYILAAFVFAALPVAVLAAQIHAGESYTLDRDATVPGDLYAVGGEVTIGGKVDGDLVSAGGTVLVSGTVTGDVLAAGGNLTILGTVGDDLRVAGGSITINGSVAGDLVVAGGQVTVAPGAAIGGDVVAAGGVITLGGRVSGEVKSAAGELRINDLVSGNVTAVVDKIRIGENGEIGGNLSYRTAKAENLENRGTVHGATNFTERPKMQGVGRKSVIAILSGWMALKFLMLLAAALVFVLALPRFTARITERARYDFWYSLLWGAGALVIGPIAIVISAITVIGLPFAAIGVLGYGIGMILASLLAGVIVGSLAGQRISQIGPGLTWRTAVSGVVLLTLVKLIPIIGWIICFGFFLVALGALTASARERFLNAR